jgi:hypothetical protein
MTFDQAVQLYAPLAGIAAIIFALGMLWQRVKALEGSSPAIVDLKVEMARLATHMTNLADHVGGIKDDTHNALSAMDGKVAELNHMYRNRIAAMEAAEQLATRAAKG